MTDLKKCAAEAVGTFYLCFAGIGAILCVTMNGWGGDSGGLLIIAMAHGLALSIAVSITTMRLSMVVCEASISNASRRSASGMILPRKLITS